MSRQYKPVYGRNMRTCVKPLVICFLCFCWCYEAYWKTWNITCTRQIMAFFVNAESCNEILRIPKLHRVSYVYVYSLNTDSLIRSVQLRILPPPLFSQCHRRHLCQIALITFLDITYFVIALFVESRWIIERNFPPPAVFFIYIYVTIGFCLHPCTVTVRTVDVRVQDSDQDSCIMCQVTKVQGRNPQVEVSKGKVLYPKTVYSSWKFFQFT